MSGRGWGEETGCKTPPYEIGNYSVSLVNISSVDLLITRSVKHFMELNKSRGRWTALFAAMGLEYSGGDTRFKRLFWQHCGCPGRCVSVLGGVQCFGWTSPRVTAGHVQVSKQGVLLMSRIYIASPLLELTKNIQTAFTVTRVSLDWVIQRYVPLGIPIMGQCSPSKVCYLHLLPVVLQVAVSASEPFGSRMPVFVHVIQCFMF